MPHPAHDKLADVLARVHDMAEELGAETGRAPDTLEGQIQALADAVENLSERYRSQAQQRRDLQDRVSQVERLALVGEFSASLSHELRAPLQTILSANELIQIRDLSPRVETLTRMIEREVLRANRLIDNARSLTRRPVHLESVDLQRLFDEFAVFSRSLLALQDVQLVVADLSTLPPIRVDADQLRQVILNLVTNAVDATTARYGSEPHPQRRIEVDARCGGDGVTLSVRDFGNGIAESAQHRIFDPFYTTRPGGLGIGLSITKRLVEDQGGTLSFDTSPEGARFHVTLPVSASLSPDLPSEA